jgi:hypothetical protein
VTRFDETLELPIAPLSKKPFLTRTEIIFLVIFAVVMLGFGIIAAPAKAAKPPAIVATPSTHPCKMFRPGEAPPQFHCKGS